MKVASNIHEKKSFKITRGNQKPEEQTMQWPEGQTIQWPERQTIQ
jgi:hypothetical protein